jgi:hypothetical protein
MRNERIYLRTEVKQQNHPDLVARIVRKGDRYGANLSLIHEEEEPLVEFYDPRYPFCQDEDGAVIGQFVSRYSTNTIFGLDNQGFGINLQGGVPDWVLESDSHQQLKTWANEVLRDFPPCH